MVALSHCLGFRASSSGRGVASCRILGGFLEGFFGSICYMRFHRVLRVFWGVISGRQDLWGSGFIKAFWVRRWRVCVSSGLLGFHHVAQRA